MRNLISLPDCKFSLGYHRHTNYSLSSKYSWYSLSCWQAQISSRLEQERQSGMCLKRSTKHGNPISYAKEDKRTTQRRRVCWKCAAYATAKQSILGRFQKCPGEEWLLGLSARDCVDCSRVIFPSSAGNNKYADTTPYMPLQSGPFLVLFKNVLEKSG